jgi:hypothetical protein
VPTLGPVAARRLLFLAAVAFLPVPYWAVEVERGPVVRLLLLAGMTGAAAVGEPGGVISIVAGALVAQSLLWLGALAVLSRLVVRWLPASRRGVGVAAVAGVLAALALFPVYHTPFARGGSRTNVFGVLR